MDDERREVDQGAREPGDLAAAWSGREVLDSSGQKIGVIAGAGYARKRFGVTWLLLRTAGGRTVLVPAEQIQSSGESLVLPYGRAYVEGAPALEEGRPPSQADERRLRLHFGVDWVAPAGCRAGCGLCMVNRRELRRGERQPGGT